MKLLSNNLQEIVVFFFFFEAGARSRRLRILAINVCAAPRW